MAINLWKLTGRPTEYNPLPMGHVNTIVLNPYGAYQVSFKAKSQTSAQVRISNGGRVEITFNLTPELKEYSGNFTTVGYDRNYIYDTNNRGDIIIQDIVIIEKPVDKATINGIDGFMNKKWNLSSNTKVIDDETLESSSNGIYSQSALWVDVEGAKNYTVSGKITGNGLVYTQFFDKDKVMISNSFTLAVNTPSFTTTTPVNCKFIKVLPSNSTTSGTATFSNLAMNLGSIVAPYSKKTGDRMVAPVPEGNIFINKMESGYLSPQSMVLTNSSSHKRNVEFIPVDSSLSYYISKNTANNFYIHFFDKDKKGISSLQYIGQKSVALSAFPVGAVFVKFHFDDTGNNGVDYSSYQFYTDVQINDKPKVKVPKKNIFEGFLVKIPNTLSRVGFREAYKIQHLSSFLLTNNFVTLSLKRNTSYTLSFKASSITPNNGEMAIFNHDATVAITPNYSFKPFTFNTGNNEIVRLYWRNTLAVEDIVFEDIQLEEGSFASAYESYESIIPRANKGLALDGLRDYISTPSISLGTSWTIDAILTYESSKKDFEFFMGTNHNTGNFAKILLNRTGKLCLSYPAGTYHHFNVSSSEILNSKRRLTFVSNSESVKLYIDGVLKDTIFVANVNFDINTIGNAWSDTAWMPKLTLHSIRAHSKPLTQQEISNNSHQDSVLDYDFTNPLTLTGNRVIPNGKNLIPNFMDSRWKMHVNSRTLGRDVCRIEATAQYQMNYIDIPINPNAKYTFSSEQGRYSIQWLDSNGTIILKGGTPVSGSFTLKEMIPPADAVMARVNCYTNAIMAFDFIKPQLYELTSTVGTVSGTPIPQLKASKQTLYAKR